MRTPATGTVESFDHSFGFGYITPDDGGDRLFFDFTDIQASPRYLTAGQSVEFDRIDVPASGKTQAVRIRPIYAGRQRRAA